MSTERMTREEAAAVPEVTWWHYNEEGVSHAKVRLPVEYRSGWRRAGSLDGRRTICGKWNTEKRLARGETPRHCVICEARIDELWLQVLFGPDGEYR